MSATTRPPLIAMDLRQAAAETGVSKSTLLAAIRAGDLIASKSSNTPNAKLLVRPADLEAWFQGLSKA